MAPVVDVERDGAGLWASAGPEHDPEAIPDGWMYVSLSSAAVFRTDGVVRVRTSRGDAVLTGPV